MGFGSMEDETDAVTYRKKIQCFAVCGKDAWLSDAGACGFDGSGGSGGQEYGGRRTGTGDADVSQRTGAGESGV